MKLKDTDIFEGSYRLDALYNLLEAKARMIITSQVMSMSLESERCQAKLSNIVTVVLQYISIYVDR